MPTSPNRIAVLRGGAIGDFVLTLPAIDALCRAYPAASLRLFGSPEILRLACADEVLDHNSAALAPLYAPGGPLPPRTRDLVSGLDLFLAYAVDPDGTFEARTKSLLGNRAIVHDPRPAPGSTAHMTDHLLEPLDRLGISVPDPFPRIRLCGADRTCAEALWKDHGLRAPVVALHPGSGGRHKCWPLDRYLDLIDALHRREIRTLVLHGPAEAGLVRALAGRLPASCIRCAPAGLRELAGLLERADLFVGNDSGPGHIAAAVGTPTLSLFGPTDPRVWAPRGPRARILRAPGGRLEDLPVDAVLSDLLHHLENIGKADPS